MKEKLFRIAFKKSIVTIILGVLFTLAGIASLANRELKWGLFDTGLGILLLYMFALPLVNGGYMKSVDKTLAFSGISMAQVEADLASALHNEKYDLGRQYGLIYGAEPKLVILRNLVWCYIDESTKTVKSYGIFSGRRTKIYSVKLIDRDQCKTTVQVKNEEAGVSLLKAIDERVPGVVLGSDEKTKQLARTDWAGLVRYVDEKNAGI